MKKLNLKKTLIALFAMMMLCGAMTAQPVGYGIKIAGTEITSSNMSAINNTNFPNLGLERGTISFSPVTNMIALHNVKVNLGPNSDFIRFEHGVTNSYSLYVIGENEINAMNSDLSDYGIINPRNNFEIWGRDMPSLKITCPRSYAIWAQAGSNLTISGVPLDLNGKGGIAGYYGSSTLKIENTTVRATATGGANPITADFSCITNFKSITLNGCRIKQPSTATIANNGSRGKAVMDGGAVVQSEVIIERNKYGISIAGTEITSTNAAYITTANFPDFRFMGTGYVIYDHASKTITMHNLDGSIDHYSKNFISISGNADYGKRTYTIRLSGTNKMSVPGGYAISSWADLLITGDRLILNTPNKEAITQKGKCNLTIKDCMVEATGMYGVRGSSTEDDRGGLIVDNATLRAQGSGGSILDLTDITLTRCAITSPLGAEVATNGTRGKAVMRNGGVEQTLVAIEPIPSYGIYIAGTEITAANAGAINNTNFPNLGLERGTISYDHTTKTITLDKVKANVSDDLENFLYITSEAENAEYKLNILGTSINEIYARSGVIHTARNLTVTGAWLKATSDSRTFVVGENSTLTLKDADHIEIESGSGGISGYSGTDGQKLIIDNTMVMITGQLDYGAIFGLQDITIRNCHLTFPAGATVATNGTQGKAVMKDGEVVKSKVIISSGYGIYIADTELTPANVSAINNTNFPRLGLNRGIISYDHATATLTLNNVTANVNGTQFLFVDGQYYKRGYKLNLVGTNEVNIISGAKEAILTDNGLTITGSSIKLDAPNEAAISLGIGSELWIENATVEATGKWGIRAFYDGTDWERLVINNSTVKATGREGSILKLWDITLARCVITAPQGAVVDNNGSEGMAVMKDGQVVKSQVVIQAEGTGISTPLTESLSLYPNPANDYVIIETDVIGSDVTLTDLTGRTVLTATATEGKTTLNIAHLSAGTYMVRVGDRVGKVVKR